MHIIRVGEVHNLAPKASARARAHPHAPQRIPLTHSPWIHRTVLCL